MLIKNIHQKNLLIELLIVFAAMMILIWTSLYSRWLTLAGALFTGLAILTSWRWREDSFADIGLCVSVSDVRQLPRALLWLSIALAGVAVIGHFIHPHFWNDPEIQKKISGVSLGYMLGIPFQEGLLHGYFTNRIGKIFPGRHHLGAGIVATLFALVHLPNPVLMPATFVFAGGSAYFFLARSKNLYFFCFAHLMLSTIVKHLVAVPLIGHGSMRVGPGFWQ